MAHVIELKTTYQARPTTMPNDTAIHPTPTTHHRFHLLDALRGLAAVLVVFWHAPAFAKLPWQQNGFLAVDFFFCLSGFVIAFSYERRLEASLSFRDFVVARFVRLYPVYFAAVVLGLCICLLYVAKSHAFGWLAGCILPFFFFQSLMLPAAHTAATPWLFPLDFPAWSIFFEIIANLVYAALVRKRLARTRHLGTIFLSMLALLVLWVSCGKDLDEGSTHSLGSIAVGIIRVLLSFLAGVLVLRVLRQQTWSPWTAVRSTLAALVVAAALVLLLMGQFPFGNSSLFRIFTIGFLFPGLVYLGALCRLPSAFTLLCSTMGDLSYPVYLFHVHFLRVLQLPSSQRFALLHPALRLCWVSAVLLVCAPVCHLVLQYYDVPVRSYLLRKYKTRAVQPSLTS